MCLDTVHENTIHVKKAYQVRKVNIHSHDGKVRTYSPLFQCQNQLIKGEWYRASNKTLETNNGLNTYESGWHCFVKPGIAFLYRRLHNEVVVEVEVDEIVASGKQIINGLTTKYLADVVVAKKVKIIKEIPAWYL